MKNILLIGIGEVGSAIKKIEEDAGNRVYVQEIDNVAPELIYDICHINIGYGEHFTKIVSDYLLKYKPNLTIINSTVKLGTTDFLAKSLNMPIVHSPIRGVHPDLCEGIRTFVKIIGGDEESSIMATKHFNSIGLKTHWCGDSKVSEIGKMFSTTYYNLCIQFSRLVKDICDKEDISFAEAYNYFNNTYNQGYKKLGMDNVIRPTLYPPKDGVPGGHCQIPNIYLLPDSELKDVAMKLNKLKNNKV